MCWAAFRVFDLDGNGKISAQDLAQVLLNTEVQNVFSSPASLCSGNAHQMTASVSEGKRASTVAQRQESHFSAQHKQHQLQQVKNIIQEVDRNGDGEVRRKLVHSPTKVHFKYISVPTGAKQKGLSFYLNWFECRMN